MSEITAYWRNDKKDRIVHFYTECPEIQEAKSISRGTVQEAIRSGHGVTCQKCKEIKCKKEIQEKTQNAHEKFVKENDEKEKRLKIGIYCFITTIFVFLFCFFTMHVPQSGKEQEAYNTGYQDGYVKGKEDGTLSVYNSGYEKAREAFSDSEQGMQNAIDDILGNQIVYITSTGHKYHRNSCYYLSKSCYSIKLEDAKAQGYTPCSACNPPQ